MNQPFIPPAEVAEDVRAALAEDIGTGEISSFIDPLANPFFLKAAKK